MSREHLLERATYYLTFGSAVSILFSIAISQILLALAVALLLFANQKLEFPPIRVPLAIFFVVTVLAVLASGDPQRGMPQLRKFFVFCIVLVLFSTFRNVRQVRAVVICWAAVGAGSAVVGVAQFLHRRRDAFLQNANNYGFYVDGRLTGFASHWMTFGGEEMIVLLILISFLLFSDLRHWRILLWPVAVLIWISIALGMTRSVFLLGLPVGVMYLAWRRRRLYVALFLLGSAIGIALAPAAVRERVVSVAKPHQDIDSNSQRAVCRIVGWQMVKSHPWFGVGPEQIAGQFNLYIPSSVPLPLPRGWYGHLHNLYLQYAAERGLPALSGFLWLIGVVMSDFFKTLRHPALTREGCSIINGAIAVIIAVLAEGLFEYNLGDSEVLTMFLSVISCGYIVVRQVREGSPKSAPTSSMQEGSRRKTRS